MELAADEFIRRFLMHVLPAGFHRIRYYGLYGPFFVKLYFRHCARPSYSGTSALGRELILPPPLMPQCCLTFGVALRLGSVPPLLTKNSFIRFSSFGGRPPEGSSPW